jgi:4-amino-4-deoxy-L-arabinose transferase-like glycosyltransferase
MLKHVPLIFVLLCGTVLFGINVSGYDLWSPDEPRFAQVAREILQTGDWLVMHVNGEPYYEKPPLMFWMIALFSLPFGDVSEFSARMPSILGALATLLLTFLLAERMYGKRVAFTSSIILMTMALFWWQARTAQIDMVLTAWITLTVFAFWRHSETRETKWLVVMYAAMAAAVLAKGPPGIVFPLLLAFAFYWRQREQRRSLHLVIGVAAVAIVVGLWLIPAYSMAGTEETRPHMTEDTSAGMIAQNLYRQTIGRFVLGVSKKQPPWYYLVNLPINVFPWTFFLPWVIYTAWKRRREGPAMRLLLCWILPAIVFFSISSGKRAIYLLPIFPAIAILFGTTLIELMDSDRTKWRRRTGYTWAALMLLLGLPAFPLAYMALSRNLDEFGAFLASQDLPVAITDNGLTVILTVLPLCICALAFFIHAAVSAWRVEGRMVPYAMAGHFAGLAAVLTVIVYPFVNTFKGAGDFCAPIRTLAEQGKDFRLYSVAFSREGYVYYSEHHHIPFLVDDWPLPTPEGRDPEEIEVIQRAIGGVLRKATQSVPIADITAVTDEELAGLRASADAAFAFASGKSDLVEPFRVAVTEAIQEFTVDFGGPGPAFMFVQTQDWRWLLSFSPTLRELPVAGHEAVGSRQVLLVANGAGAQLLWSDPGNTPPSGG